MASPTYYEKHREKLIQYQREYYYKNKGHVQEYLKEYYNKHRERLKQGTFQAALLWQEETYSF